jgi:hypothetical protein
MVKRVLWGMFFALVSAACVHEVDHESQPMARLDGDRHVTIRAEAGRLWWSYYPWSEPHPLWALPAQGRVANITIRPVLSKDDGFIVTFEQGGALWEGEIGDGLATPELARRD